MLGVIIDQNLDFEEHITLLLNEGNKKLHALMRIAKYLTQDKLGLKTFIESRFNYCPLIWMCQSRGLNQRTVNKGVETIRCRGPKIWEIVPEEIKKSK